MYPYAIGSGFEEALLNLFLNLFLEISGAARSGYTNCQGPDDVRNREVGFRHRLLHHGETERELW